MRKFLSAAVFGLAAAAAAVFWFFYPSPKGMLNYAAGISAAAAIAVVYLAFGLKLLKLFKIEEKPALKYPYAFALSYAAISTIVFAAGFLKLYNYFFAAVLFIACAVISAGEIREMIKSLMKKISGAGEIKASVWEITAMASAGAALFYVFLASMAPATYYDSLVYHLGVPQQYIAACGIINIRENVFSYFPQAAQMNYLFVMLLTNELVIKLFQFLTAGMAAMAVWGIAEKIGACRKTALLLLFTCPLFMLNASRIGAELPLMLFTLLLLSVLVTAAEAGADAALCALAGVFSGLIISVKYTGVIVYLFAAAVLVVLIIKKRAKISGLALYLAIPAAVVLPYLLRNYFFTGNPVYPLFSGFFNTEEGLARDASAYVSHVAGFGVPVNFANFFIYPFLAVFDAGRFGGDIISPLFLVSMALLPFTDLKKTALPAVFIVVYMTVWFFTGQVLRFLLPVVPAAALIFAQAFRESGSIMKYIAVSLIAAAQLFTSFYFVERYISPFKALNQEREEYMSDRVSYYPAAKFLNALADKKAAVLVLGDARVFYIERPAMAYTVFNNRDGLDGFEGLDEKKVLDGLAWRNIRYVLVNNAELSRLKGAGFGDVYGLVNGQKFKNIMDKYFKKIYSDDRCDIYEISGRQ